MYSTKIQYLLTRSCISIHGIVNLSSETTAMKDHCLEHIPGLAEGSTFKYS